MDERSYLSQALLDRLREDGLPFRTLSDEIALVVEREAFCALPRHVARFCHEYDVQLVRLCRAEHERWSFLLAWSDEVGRPSFLGIEAVADYFRAGRRLARCAELLAGAPDALFLFALAEGLEARGIDERRAEWLATLWHANPSAVMERIARHWRSRGDVRRIAHAAKHADWRALQGRLPELARGLRRGTLPSVAGIAGRLRVLFERLLRPEGASLAFAGVHDAALAERIARELARAGVRVLSTSAADIAVALRGAEASSEFEEVIRLDDASSAVAAPKVQRAVLRWLECRVERRYPEIMVGRNPWTARLLQLARRHRIPFLGQALGLLLNSDIGCRLSSPVLMPHPYGIVIHPQTVIGSRVTVMHHATLGSRRPGEPGAPVIEDNVFIGPGAMVLGEVRVGRGAVIGANAVVTRDVPSHCTVVGANRILGAGTSPADDAAHSDETRISATLS